MQSACLDRVVKRHCNCVLRWPSMVKSNVTALLSDH